MNRKTKAFFILLGVLAGLMFITVFPMSLFPQVPPRICTSDFIELDKIEWISKFRSYMGHDFSDLFEHDRSMKHYFNPKSEYGYTNDNISIYSPTDGIIVTIEYESHQLQTGEIRGKHVIIMSLLNPMFFVTLFHVNVQGNLNVGMIISSGDLVGYADCREGGNVDVAIQCQILGSYKYYSYFDVMTDDVFSSYQTRGLQNRSAIINSKALADSVLPMWGGDYSSPEYASYNIFTLT
ncbi:MAG: hypothetical protein ACTSRW_06015 [Candidatus Helarchaeota archaeon]